MNPARKRILWVLAIAMAAPLALYFSSIWLVPWLVRERFLPQLQQFARQEVQIGAMRFQPWLLRLQLDQVSIRNREELYFVAEKVHLDFSPASWWEKKPHLRHFRCQGFTIRIVRRPDGALNWSDLGPSPGGYQRRPVRRASAWKLPILAVEVADMVDGRIVFLDRTLPDPVERTVENINLQLTGLDTGTSADNRLSLTASLQNGGSLQWNGSFSLQPLRSGGAFRLQQLDLGQHREYLSKKGYYSLDQALLSAEVEYFYDPRLGDSPLRVKLTEGLLEDVRFLRADGTPWFSCTGISVEKAQWEPMAGKAEMDRLVLRKPVFEWRRLGDGRQEPMVFWAEETGATTATSVIPRQWWVGRVAVRELHLTWRDEMHSPARVLSWHPVTLDLEGYETGGEEPVLLTAILGREQENLLRLTAELAPDPLVGSAKLTLRNFPLWEWKTYLQPWLTAEFSRGFLQATADVEFEQGLSQPTLTVTGTASLDDWEFLSGDEEIPPLSWSALWVDTFHYDHYRQKLDLGIIHWVEPTLLFESSDLYRNAFWARFHERGVLRLIDRTRELQLSLQEARIIGGMLHYINEGTTPGLNLQASYLEAYFGPWEHRPDAAGAESVSLSAPFRSEALINDQASLELEGRWWPSHGQPELTWKAHLHRFSVPWAEAPARYLAGYAFPQGTLDWQQSGEYRADRLQTANRFSIENLRLGNNLGHGGTSLELAVALLEGPDRQFTLDLPFHSELAPTSTEFPLEMQRAWQERIAEIVRHPYRILLGAESPEGSQAAIAFAPGSADLLPAGSGFLEQLGQALQQRPLLRLTVAGNVHPRLDGAALSRQRMEQAVSQVGFFLRGEEPLPTQQELREILYMMTFGRPAPFTTLLPPPSESLGEKAGRKTSGGFWNRVLSSRQPREPMPPPPPPLEITNREQMEAELADHFQATLEDLQTLALLREKAVVAYLQEEAGLDPSRIALLNAPPQDQAAAEVVVEVLP